MSENPDEDRQRKSNEIKEEEEEESTFDLDLNETGQKLPRSSHEIKEEEDEDAMLDRELDKMRQDAQRRYELRQEYHDDVVKVLVQSIKEDEQKELHEVKTTRRELTDEENTIDHPRFIHDPKTGTTFHLMAYAGSSFNGKIKVYTGIIMHEGERDLASESFIVAKTVDVKEPSQALNDLLERDLINGLVPDHPNIVGVKCSSLTVEGTYSVVFQDMLHNSMSMSSLRSILGIHFPNGMPLTYIVVCLREALKGLSEIHRRGQVHKEISAGQILLGRDNDIKLAFSATIHDYGLASSSSSYLPISEISKWASAPEVYESENGEYGPKADIWLIGIVAVELAYGGFQVRDRAQLEKILEDIHKNRKLPPRPNQKKKNVSAVKSLILSCVSFESQKDKWKDFEPMVVKCLERDPNERPNVEQLLSFEIFAEEEKDAAFVFDGLRAVEASKG